MQRILLIAILLFVHLTFLKAAEPRLEVRQLTQGPLHHFYGYIGHVQNIPWNRSGRYIATLRTSVRDHLPTVDEPAEIVLLDCQNNYSPRVVERTRAWNPQQGTMLYWNPLAQETQFFFNDRDPATNKTFCVLFDIAAGEEGKRVREYRFDEVAIGNGGVAQHGGKYLGINYGRMAILRRVTGYAGDAGSNAAVKHPDNDGVFLVDVESGQRRLLVSFKDLAAKLRGEHPGIDQVGLFINHTLWSRDDSRCFFFVRGGWDEPGPRINVPMVMNADGSNLRPLQHFIGGHPEWFDGQKLIGSLDKKQVIYDTDKMEVAGTLGDEEKFPQPEGDCALSPDGKWFANGYRVKDQNLYSLLRLADGKFLRSTGFDVRGYTGGDLRVDPAPWWNRQSNQILISALSTDADRTRQLFLLTIRED